MKFTTVLFLLALAGCGTQHKASESAEDKATTLKQDVAEATAIAKQKAMTMQEVMACNRLPPEVHDPSKDKPYSYNEPSPEEARLVKDMAVGESWYVWGITKEEDGTLWLNRFMTGYRKKSPTDDILVTRNGDGFSVSCEGRLFIWLDKDGPNNKKADRSDLIPVVSTQGEERVR